MIIETKFDIGEIVWFIHNNKIHQSTIYSLFYNNKGGFTALTYIVTDYSNGSNPPMFKENELFTTKEELINSL